MHTAPADFAFGGEAFAVSGGDFTGFAEGFGDFGGIACGVGGPVGGTACGVDADDAVGAGTVLFEDVGDAAGFFDGEDEVFAVVVGAEGAAADGAWPDWGDEGADFEAFGGDFIGHGADIGFGGVGVGVGVEEEEVDAFVLRAVDFGGGGEIEHAVEADRWVIGAGFFTDEAWPHGVVESGERVGHFGWIG